MCRLLLSGPLYIYIHSVGFCKRILYELIKKTNIIPMSSSNAQYIRWNIFAGILFSVAGMCFLNYYSLFPDVDKRDEEINNNKDIINRTS